MLIQPSRGSFETVDTALESSRREERSFAGFKRSTLAMRRIPLAMRRAGKLGGPLSHVLTLNLEGHGGLQVRHAAPHAALIRASAACRQAPSLEARATA